METYLRGVVGRPHQHLIVELDSAQAAEIGSGLAETETVLTRTFDQMTVEELNQIDLALIAIDPSGTVAWEFRGACPTLKSPRNPGI